MSQKQAIFDKSLNIPIDEATEREVLALHARYRRESPGQYISKSAVARIVLLIGLTTIRKKVK